MLVSPLLTRRDPGPRSLLPKTLVAVRMLVSPLLTRRDPGPRSLLPTTLVALRMLVSPLLTRRDPGPRTLQCPVSPLPESHPSVWLDTVAVACSVGKDIHRSQIDTVTVTCSVEKDIHRPQMLTNCESFHGLSFRVTLFTWFTCMVKENAVVNP